MNKKRNDIDDDFDDFMESDIPDTNDSAMLECGILFLSGPITQSNTLKAIKYIIAENHLLSLNRILLHINSPGGDLGAAFNLIATMRDSMIPIYTYAAGDCASAATMILMSGAKGNRYIDKNCTVLSHQYSASSPGLTKHEDILARSKDFAMTADKIITHYVEHTGLSKKHVQKKLVKGYDVYLTAAEAIKFNIADYYITENTSVLYDSVINLAKENAVVVTSEKEYDEEGNEIIGVDD